MKRSVVRVHLGPKTSDNLGRLFRFEINDWGNPREMFKTHLIIIDSVTGRSIYYSINNVSECGS